EALERARADVAALLVDVLALELAPAALQPLDQHLRGFDEELARIVLVDAIALELHPAKPAAHAEDEAAVRLVIEYANLLGNAHRIVPGQYHDHRTELHARGAAGEVGQILQHVGAHRVVGEVMLDA